MSQKIDSSFQHINKLLVNFYIYIKYREKVRIVITLEHFFFIITDLIY